MEEKRYTESQMSCNSNFRLRQSELCILNARNRAWRGASTVIHGHLQVQGDAKSTVGQALDTDHFRHIFAVHRVVCRGVRKGDEHTHAFRVVSLTRVKINAFF